MLVFIISIAYIAITLAIGIIVSKKNKDSKTFFVAQGKLTLPLCCVLLLASTFAGAYTSGAISDSYNGGFATYLPIAAMGVGYILFIFLIPFYRSASKEGAISIPDAFALRFDSRSRVTMMILLSIAYAVTFAVQPVAFARIVAPMLNLNVNTVSWAAAAVMAVMAMCGLTGVAWMNTIHCLVMIVGLSLISIVSMGKAGGVGNIVATVDPSMWNMFVPDPLTIIVRFIALAICMFPASEASTIAIGAKTTKTARRAVIIIGIVICLFTVLLVMTGISAHVILGDDLADSSSTLYLVSSQLGIIFNIIASVAVLAAITSSAPAYLIYFSTNVTLQITHRMAEDKKEKANRVISIICIILTAFIGTFFAQKATSILNVLFCVFEVLTVPGLVLLIGVYWKRVSAGSAFWSMALASAATIVWLLLGCPFGIIPGWIAMVATLVLIVVFTLLEKKPVSDDYQRMHEIIEKHKLED